MKGRGEKEGERRKEGFGSELTCVDTATRSRVSSEFLIRVRR